MVHDMVHEKGMGLPEGDPIDYQGHPGKNKAVFMVAKKAGE